jgi:hypothetical protein
MTLGESGKAADTGYKIGASPVKRAAGPFHRVTNVAVLPDGDMYIADGYGNARVHKFSKEGKLLFSWGEPGRGPGQFILPHGIAVDSAGLVYVADRENSRVQIFNPKGEYLREWTFLNRPYDIFIDDQDMLHIAEGGISQLHAQARGRSSARARRDDDLPARRAFADRPGHGVRSGGEDPLPGRRRKSRCCPAISLRRTASGRTSAATCTSARWWSRPAR